MKSSKKEKPKYNLFEVVCFMVRQAVQEKSMVLLTCPLWAILPAALSVTELYVTPSILGILERKESLSQLLWAVLIDYYFAVFGKIFGYNARFDSRGHCLGFKKLRFFHTHFCIIEFYLRLCSLQYCSTIGMKFSYQYHSLPPTIQP